MTAQTQPTQQQAIVYPESDGQPIADNTLQFRWIVTIQGGFAALYRNQPDVFVAGDLLWYPVEGQPTIRQAPDTLVVYGRPKGERGSYLQWREDHIAPLIVFEVLSPGNTRREMERKLLFYQRYGVEEYYIYDPDHGELDGYIRNGEWLNPIATMQGWVSPRSGVRFALEGVDLVLTRSDGELFKSYLELEEERIAAETARQQAETARQQAEDRAAALAARLRALGVDPDKE